MNSRKVRAPKSFWLAALFSLVLHSVILFVDFSSSEQRSRTAENPDDTSIAARPRLRATLARPASPAPVQPSPVSPATPAIATKEPARSPKKPAAPKKLTAPPAVQAKRPGSEAERANSTTGSNEPSTPSRALTGQELSRSALAMARQMGRSAQDDGVDAASKPPQGNGKAIEPYSLQMYFDAFLRKLNRSAAFVKNERRAGGTRKALVEISLNADGSLKDYRVLRSGDQNAEIAYIKSVLDRASPFSAFPPDIRKARDWLAITMCIYPPNEAGGGGGFTRTFDDQDCKD